MRGASNKRFSEELEQAFDQFPNYHKNLYSGILMQTVERRYFEICKRA